MHPSGNPNDPLKKAEKIGQVFSTLNRKFEEEEAQRRAASLQLPYFDLTGFPIDQNALELVPREQAEGAEVIPFFQEGSMVKLGIVNPQNPGLKVLLAELEKKKFKPEISLVSESGFTSALKNYRKILPTRSVEQHEIVLRTGTDIIGKFQSLSGIEPRELASKPMGQIVELMIGAAVSMRSSDIHIEPERDHLKIRLRIDGVLQDVVNFPIAILRPLMSRIKLLSSLKLNVTTVPQDGRFSAKLGNRNVDLRVSVLPSAFGESVVMRLLGVEDNKPEVEKLGLREKPLKLVYQELGKPNGMLLTTGPTGSGKTTTLYAFLNYLNRPGVKIITLEDPVEYKIENIIQTPMDRSAGMDFAKGLRSILRQDPDIVMVGEIRDFETAETAAQAALTGHVVMSTLHTNDAIGAIPRLLDLGVKPVTLAPALNALIAQRLLRKLCENCKEAYQPAPKELQRVKEVLANISPDAGVKAPEVLTFSKSKGCHVCHDIGYHGRLGVFEVFVVDEEVEKIIYAGGAVPELKKAAHKQGMLTMQQDGILKALQGLTDLAEVWRVTEE